MATFETHAALAVTGYAVTAQPRVTYAIGVDKALGQFGRYRERPVGARGVMVPGSLVKSSRNCDAKFKLGRYQPGDDCPICEHALNTRARGSLSHPK